MPRGYRTGRIAMLLAIVLGILTLSFSTASRASRLQDAADVIEAGSGPLGERSFSLVGRNVYGADRLQLYGYLSRVVGLRASDLFTEEPGSVQTARFTYAAELSDVSSAGRADITITEGAGVLRVFFAPSGGATWDDPASFAAGEIVAEFSLDLRDVLQLQSPGVGVSVGDGQTVQQRAAEFALDGEQVRFGGEGMERRIRYVAALEPESDAAVRFLTSLSGSATMTARPSRAVPLGGTAAATPATSLDACAGLQPWLDRTLASLSRAAELGDVVAPEDPLADVDRTELLQASQELTELVAAQRDLDAPDEAAAANRLAVTALSTLSRGLQGASDAAEENDDERFAQGQAALADGRSLIARAGEAVNAVAETCAG